MPIERPPRYLTNPEELKALTHPLRQRILFWLRTRGPATSAELASTFSEDRGATSYHLRQLARHGYLEVDEERSAGRRKYWRVVHQDLRLPEPEGVDGAVHETAEQLRRQWLQSGLEELANHWRERGRDPEWDAASMISYGSMRLTRDEMRRFSEEYVALARRWARDPADAPPDAEPVTALFTLFRTPQDEH